MKLNKKEAVAAINKYGMLLVFPQNNKVDPHSLWSHFFPKKKMNWKWETADESGLTDLWNLKTELSTSKKVVYTKWYQDKATFISAELFCALFKVLNSDLRNESRRSLSKTSLCILNQLEADSPISSKELKKMVSKIEKRTDVSLDKAMKELWTRLLIVAYGEFKDGSFPSLGIAATETVFEDLWIEANKMSDKSAMTIIERYLPKELLFRKHLEKIKKGM